MGQILVFIILPCLKFKFNYGINLNLIGISIVVNVRKYEFECVETRYPLIYRFEKELWVILNIILSRANMIKT